uniref:Uncharacterized protein n=1 Tax=Aegilops tauschii subsp. strangulata TaxID=200361 RepID=A0A453ECA1_AEGTS
MSTAIAHGMDAIRAHECCYSLNDSFKSIHRHVYALLRTNGLIKVIFGLAPSGCTTATPWPFIPELHAS